MKPTCHFWTGLLLCWSVTCVAAPRYKLTVLDSANSNAVAINNAGQIAGNRTVSGVDSAFTWQDGRYEALPDLISSVHAISSQGHIAGATVYQYGGSGYWRSTVVYHRGVLQELSNPFFPGYYEPYWYAFSRGAGVNGAGKVISHSETNNEKGTYLTVNGEHAVLPLWEATAITDAGLIAGVSGRDDWPPAQAVLYDPASGHMTRLGTLRTGSYAYSYPADLNDAGVVVGSSYMGYGAQLHMHSFEYRDGVMAPLGNLATDNEAEAINNAGTVVGNFVAGGASHAYLYQDGAQYDLDTLLAGSAGWRIARAEDMNDSGWIVGQACSDAGACVAALLTPVPEPALWTMLVAGLGIVALRRALRGGSAGTRVLAGLLLCGAAGGAAAAPQFTLTVLDPAQGTAVGINNAGDIAGNRWDVMESRAFMWRDGQITYLPRNFAYAVAIGSQGHIVGSSPETVIAGGAIRTISGMLYYRGGAGPVVEPFEPNTSAGNWYSFTSAVGVNGAGHVVANTAITGHGGAFVADGERYTILPMERVTGINDNDQIIGQRMYDGGQERAVLYVDGQVTDLGALPTYYENRAMSVATDLNERGDVVGYSAYGGPGQYHMHSFLYRNGQMTPLGNQKGENSAAAINNLGAVVGNYDLRGTGHAYLYQEGVQYDLDTLLVNAAGWHVSSAQGINDNGQIVGQACDRYAECLPVLLNPVPEPAAYAMLLAGLGLVGWCRRRAPACNISCVRAARG
jgi:probable HAF family extracellular repeat protein